MKKEKPMNTPKKIRATLAALLGVILTLEGLAVQESSKESRPATPLPILQVSANNRFLQTADGKPFFWTGDTAWIAIERLTREEMVRYFQDRSSKGFNVLQVMLIRELPTANVYGAQPFVGDDPTQPLLVPVDNNFWTHVDYFVDEAANHGFYVALVPMWGNAAKKLPKDGEWAKGYGAFLANRYGKRTNIIWLNGGDILGSKFTPAWENLGTTLDAMTTNQLITYHPFARSSSSEWFHDRKWLDFNMFQSGHRTYDQRKETDPVEKWKGEDNWKHVVEDLALNPPKPTIDGEPSYEDIPRGLHDPKAGYWTAPEIRRYEYWSVFSGSFGLTFGNNAVFQFHAPKHGEGFFYPRKYWEEALNDPGAGQMHYLKDLMLSRSFFDRVPDQSLVAGKNGERYEYIVATRGNNYAFLYTYTGRAFDVVGGKIAGAKVKATWMNPRTGEKTVIGDFDNTGILHFQPPGQQENGNDWVLILDSQLNP
jgi:hypothetical protein